MANIQGLTDHARERLALRSTLSDGALMSILNHGRYRTLTRSASRSHRYRLIYDGEAGRFLVVVETADDWVKTVLPLEYWEAWPGAKGGATPDDRAAALREAGCSVQQVQAERQAGEATTVVRVSGRYLADGKLRVHKIGRVVLPAKATEFDSIEAMARHPEFIPAVEDLMEARGRGWPPFFDLLLRIEKQFVDVHVPQLCPMDPDTAAGIQRWADPVLSR